MRKYATLQRINLESLYNTFVGLPARQQTMALVGAIVGALLIVVLPLSLAAGKLHGLETEISSTRTKMGEMAREIDQYNKVRAKKVALETFLKSGFDASIAATLEAIGTQAEMKEHVDALKEKPVVPSEIYDEVSVEVKVSRVTLQQLVGYLHKIENAPNKVLRIKRIEVRARFDNRHLVDATFEVASYKLTQETEG